MLLQPVVTVIISSYGGGGGGGGTVGTVQLYISSKLSLISFVFVFVD